MIVCFGPSSSYTPWTRRICKDEASVNSEWILQAQEFQHVSGIIEEQREQGSGFRREGYGGVYWRQKHRAKFKVT